MAVAAGFVSPSSHDDDLVTLRKAGRFRHEASDLVDLPAISCPSVSGKVDST
jgi:hypothetical protein